MPETQEGMAEGDYFDPVEIADTTLEAREQVEAGSEGGGDRSDDRGETMDPREPYRG